MVVLLVLVVPSFLVEIFPDRPHPVGIAPAPAGRYRVYVADWDYHTSIILQQPPNWQLGSLGAERAPFVEFAWGDRRFYNGGQPPAGRRVRRPLSANGIRGLRRELAR
ncbi:MAG TPA: hypothetical protein VGJ18_13925 [Gemmatimonadaceae bacterium]